jgi:hypothetical protein
LRVLVGFLHVGVKLCYPEIVFRSGIQDTSMNSEAVVGFEVLAAPIIRPLKIEVIHSFETSFDFDQTT